MIIVEKENIRADLVRIFTALSVSREDAGMIADVLLKAEQWGVSSHGILRVERYVQCLLSGGILPDAPFTVESQVGGWVRASANGGLGIPASCRAAKLTVELAKAHGIGMVNLCRSHHNGAEGIYSDYMARQGMAGLTMSTGNPIMAVTGSCEATIGNNPFSYAVPAGKYDTLFLDVAMSAVADGKVQLARAMGKELPPGCILDRNGDPSVLPEDYLNGGVLLPFGGHKGYGLAVMVECLAGILSGAALTHEINSWNEIPGHCGNTGHMFMAFDITKMQSLDRFVKSVETMIEQFKSAKKAAGIEEIYYPGEIEHRKEKAADKTVMIIPSTLQSLRRAAKQAGTVLRCC